ELAGLASHGTKPERLLALRGLGRVGGKRSLELLVGALADPDPDVTGAAAGAIGISTSLDEPAAGDPAITRALLEAWPRAGLHGALVIEAIGRAADLSAQPALVRGLAAEPRIAAACGLALGRYGRRKLELTDDARLALITATRHVDPGVRYAAAYALAREQLPSRADAREAERLRGAGTHLARLASDPDPDVRAQAVAALGRRKFVTPVRKELALALRDRDWRVAVEAVRALTGDASDDAGRDAVAAILGPRFAQLEQGDATEAHVIMEALRGLAAHTGRAPIATAIAALAAHGASLPPLARGWIECLASVGLARGAASPDFPGVEHCGHGGLPDHLRLPLLGELVTARVGTLVARQAVVRTLLSHADPRVQAAGLGTLAVMWKEGDSVDHEAAISTLWTALASTDPIIAGNAVDAATAVYEELGTGDHSKLDAAVVARALVEHEPELGAALYELIGKRKIVAGAAACGVGLVGGPVLAAAARKCLEALGITSAPAAGAATTAPPVDITGAIGRTLRWHLFTTHGDIVIALRPDIAPWAVATIVALTRKGFYDGLEFHRVVPDFVVQGGDPTQSGWGGPGFTVPAEPSAGPGFVAGGVGIADSGRDSGGSQWFVMHGRAPHLDGRYTWIGAVESGQKSADGLLIGDKVIRAVIEVRPTTDGDAPTKGAPSPRVVSVLRTRTETDRLARGPGPRIRGNCVGRDGVPGPCEIDRRERSFVRQPSCVTSSPSVSCSRPSRATRWPRWSAASIRSRRPSR
ncbi:MAG: Peptidyl-prolyl cis-trans isomerase, partial [Deltaproteobacteria bacterium]|nr:Peptidyl-prolyl cis-trans isomerase [Deltaproteobacteria bacterium]